ncbi:FAD:protein FMN transferase [Cellulomonas sp. P22]|uniref:FAD:protein FMN transferase n=1 Tax=Cellulomonas sp. P22 TaxID=3373189 RepID=UPI00378DDD9B
MTSPAPAADAGTGRRAWVEQVMGMPVSVHVRGPGARGPDVAQAVAALFAGLRAADATFSTYREDSQIRRLQRGELDLDLCAGEVREVHDLCVGARVATDGYFDAWSSPQGFDPTGLVKTWALERAARTLAALPDVGAAVGAGGDVLVLPDADPTPWHIGIEDPRDRSRTLASVPVHDGGVATSGIAARGAHIRDPRTGEAVTSVLSATVSGPSLLWADVWATAAVARGTAAVDWVHDLPGTSGLLVLADGRVHRWANPA